MSGLDAHADIAVTVAEVMSLRDKVAAHADAAQAARAMLTVLGRRWDAECPTGALIDTAPGDRPLPSAFLAELAGIEADVVCLRTALTELIEAVR